MDDTDKQIKKLCEKFQGKKDVEDRILDEVASEVIARGADFIIQELSWATEEKEPFAEEKAAEKKAKALKKNSKEFGEW